MEEIRTQCHTRLPSVPILNRGSPAGFLAWWGKRPHNPGNGQSKLLSASRKMGRETGAQKWNSSSAKGHTVTLRLGWFIFSLLRPPYFERRVKLFTFWLGHQHQILREGRWYLLFSLFKWWISARFEEVLRGLTPTEMIEKKKMDNFLVDICPQNLSMSRNKLLIVLSVLMFGIDVFVEWEGVPGVSQLSVMASTTS